MHFVATLLEQIEAAHGLPRPIGISVLIETAAGMHRVDEIAAACPERMEAMVFGVADYAASLQSHTTSIGGSTDAYAVRTDAGALHWGDQWHYPLARIAVACRAHGLRPIDGPYGDFGDPEGYRVAARRAAVLGYEGKWAIHPSQIALANAVFTPDAAAAEKTRRIVAAMAEAAREGRGAVSLDGRLIDAASLRMAETLLHKLSRSRRATRPRSRPDQRSSSTRRSTWRAAPEPRKATNAAAAGLAGPTVGRTTNQFRCGSPPRGRIVPSRPIFSSSAADVRETNPTPSPARAASRSAVFDPSVSSDGASPCRRSHSSAIAREPEPSSRTSHGRPASSSTATQRRVRQRVVRRGHEHDLVDAERLAREPLVVGHAAGDRDVRAVLEQPGEDLAPVADVEVDVELRVRVAERADERRDDVVAGARHRADPQRRPAALRGLARRPAARLEQPEHVRGVRRERRAGRGRAQPAPVALEQLRADLALERGDRRRHRRLRDDELLCRSRHRPASHHGRERRELGEGDGHGGRAASAAAAPSPRARAPSSRCRRSRDPSTHEPSSGCGNFACWCLSPIP